MVQIRKANIEDATQLSLLSIQTFTESFAEYNTPENLELFLAATYNIPTLRNEIEDPQVSFFLAYVHDDLHGYAKIIEPLEDSTIAAASEIELARIYILKASKQIGIGSALLQRVIAFAKEKNYTAIWLGVWEYNPSAIAFYKKWGFEKYGEHIFMLGTDQQNDWLMRKML